MRSLLVLLVGASPLLFAAPVPRERLTPDARIERLYGVVHRPDNTYAVTLRDQALQIRVPDSTRIWEHPKNGLTVPRIVREVTGDFTAVVTITLPTLNEKNSFRKLTAGIFVMGDESEYVEHSRLQTAPAAGQPERRSGILHAMARNLSLTASSGGGAFNPDSTLHKLERTGNTVVAYASADGKSWHKLGSYQVNLNDTVKVGLFVGHDGPATVEFSNFDIITK
jgi:hypothetical protein